MLYHGCDIQFIPCFTPGAQLYFRYSMAVGIMVTEKPASARGKPTVVCLQPVDLSRRSEWKLVRGCWIIVLR